MTEDEAKTKVCPMAATFGGSQQLADGPGPCCIGSACMAWRGIATSTIVRSWTKPSDGAVQISAADYDSLPGWRLPGTVNGFCGLAGTPQ